MKLKGGALRVYNLWRSGWDIHINHETRYAYLAMAERIINVHYRHAVKAIAARDAGRRRREAPDQNRIWTP